jgi:hypothetical protein
VGHEIDSNCPRCKEETIHRVVAMVDGKVHKVICTRCSGQHRYRPSLAAMRKKIPLPSKRQATVLKKVGAAKRPKPDEPLVDWQNRKEAAGELDPPRYDMSISYQENQAIDHPSFGLGFVRRVLGASKIEVVFAYQVKTLVMNRRKNA